MSAKPYDPLVELRTFIKYSDPSIRIPRITLGRITKIVGSVNYPGLERLRAEIRIDAKALEEKYLTHIITSTPRGQQRTRSEYVHLFKRIIRPDIRNTTFITGAGIDAPLVHTTEMLDTVARMKKKEAKKAFVKEFIEQVLFCSPTDLTRSLAKIVEQFSCPLFSENWTRDLAKCINGPKVQYLYLNRVKLTKRQTLLEITLGSDINTPAWQKLRSEISKKSTKMVIFVGSSLRWLARTAIDVIEEIQKRLPVFLIALMPPKSERKEHLPVAFRGLGSGLVLYVDLWNLLPFLSFRKTTR